MFSGLPEQKVNGNSAQAVGPRETLFLWLAEQKVTGNSAQAAGPRETNVSTASFGGCAQKAFSRRSDRLNTLKRLVDVGPPWQVVLLMT